MTSKPNVIILGGYGLNCEDESKFAFDYVGAQSKIVHINDLADNPKQLAEAQILCIPGGFSYGDDTGSGNGMAQKIRLSLEETIIKFIQRDTLMIGICNGCQVTVNLGLVPLAGKEYGTRDIAVVHNESARYQCRWVDLAIDKANNSPWLKDIDTLHIPVAHGEGRFMMESQTLEALKEKNQVAARYDGLNPNGAVDDIAAITDPTGRILVMMPHPERGMLTSQRDDYTVLKDTARRAGQDLPYESEGMQIFKNAVAYFG